MRCQGKPQGIELLNMDCMKYMTGLEDNAFELAIVDPPYGIGESGGSQRTRGSKRTNGVKKEWDNERPNLQYFQELQRVSVNQIIWGGNYFADLLPASRCWIYWQKDMGGDFSDGELAYTSFDRVLKQFRKRSESHHRIHPTQKPVKLYEWLLTNYAKEGDRILDTHLGSGSSAIAAHYAGFEFVGTELDPDYFKAAQERFNNETKQQAMF
jgi:site-specific DNA-methyltransferase (adenine-specific)